MKVSIRTAITAIMLLSMGLIASANLASKPPTLNVGDKAPELKPLKWLKGRAYDHFAKGQVYVVEFWATWCGPCKQSIPHLTELAKHYGDKVNITGVSIWEKQDATDDSFVPNVQKFVDDMGEKMAYNVAADGHEKVVESAWAVPAKIPGIPTAFVVNQDGIIAWIGHPMDKMDKVLDQVLDKTWDIQKFAEEKKIEDAKQEAAAAASDDTAKEMAELNQLLKDKKVPEALNYVDKLIELHPELKSEIQMTKFRIFLQYQEADAYPYASKLAQGDLKDNPMALNSLAWSIISSKSAKNPDYAVAVKIAKSAAELTKMKDPMILDTYAYALYFAKDYDQAISIEEKAVALAEADPQFDADTKKEISDRLLLFKKKGK